MLLQNIKNEFGEPKVNWEYLYYQRSCLEENWRTGNYSVHELPGHTKGIYCIQFDEDKIISHTAFVLCLQYDDKFIISGSSYTEKVLDLRFDDRCIMSCSKVANAFTY
ncbi:hypothetical protein G9A89_010926 [Geosiphon pyriformis]|nr:hypothetical protein G9A89_010926 [Geosiphon pyriformis]